VHGVVIGIKLILFTETDKPDLRSGGRDLLIVEGAVAAEIKGVADG